jgi:uncharacterized protein YbjT (DUF2867 family)
MSEKVLVVGGTGMLGRPVAERLREDGFEVTVMTSNQKKAGQILAGQFEIVEGDVTRPATLEAPIVGKDYLYINLSAHLDPDKYQRIEIEGTANLAKVAKECGIKRIMNISSAASKGKESGVIYLDAKVKCELALIDSNVKYTVMRPSWFFESLPGFIQNGRALIIGKQPMKIHWLAAADYAAQVSRAFRTEAAANKCFYNLGPEAITMKEALQIFCNHVQSGLKAREVPIGLVKLLGLVSRNQLLKAAIPFFEYFSKNHEDVDATEADAILGKNTTTLSRWLLSHAAVI